MSAIDKEPFPRLALFVAAGLIVLSLAAATSGRYAALHAPVSTQAAMTPLAARDLHFSDAADGSVRVQDAEGAQTVAILAPGTNGFIRGVLRGLARDRRVRGLGAEQAFRLAQWPDGRLSLQDLATGKRIELGSFGATNRAAFAQILTSDMGTRS